MCTEVQEPSAKVRAKSKVVEPLDQLDEGDGAKSAAVVDEQHPHIGVRFPMV